MTILNIAAAKNLFALWPLALLVACGGGGGGGGPSVSTLSATNITFSRTMTVTVNGTGLDQGDLTMIVEGPCGEVAKNSGGSELQQQFSCTITGVGNLIPRIRNAPEGTELASLRLTVPLPQVSMTVTQGARSGSFVLELDAAAVPATATNFLAYVNAGFYRNTLFHRVVEGFVAQAGGFTFNAAAQAPAAKAPTRPAIALEASLERKNLRGTIAMARTDEPNSATAQFYLNLVDNPSLDPGGDASPEGYAVFGKVISGQEVVDEIGIVQVRNAGPGLTHLPRTNVVITAASQIK